MQHRSRQQIGQLRMLDARTAPRMRAGGAGGGRAGGRAVRGVAGVPSYLPIGQPRLHRRLGASMADHASAAALLVAVTF